jgi:cobalt-zinc-cadmium efflux system outer membrane protein
MLQVYETSLIPQATSSLNSARSAYSAGKSGFMELLDAERSLFQVRIDYYKALTKYVESLTSLEKVAGLSLSTLPFGDYQ